jgi:hypothetical protein
MADTLYRGEQQLFYITIDGTDYPVGCVTSNSIQETSDTIETTTRDNEGWKTSRPTNQSYTISVEGLQIRSNSAPVTKFSYDYLIDLKRSRTVFQWKTNVPNSGLSQTGFAYIDSISEAASVGEYLTFTANLQGYGAINTAQELADNYIVQDGNNYIFN